MSSSTDFPVPFLPPSVKALSSPPTPKIHFYTAGTPNGFKVSILLEELLLAYPDQLKEGTIAYDIYSLKFSNNDQKTERFLQINPNGRIPAIVDDNAGGHNVFETSSILIWLVENYDKENKFWFSDPLLRSKALSWIFFGPMQGQANHFFRYAPEKIPYGIKRYQDETRRLYSVLEDGLKAGKGEWLVGDMYSIADISIFGWVNSHKWAGLEDISEFPLLVKWIERIRERQGAKQGLDIPEPRKEHKSKEDEDKAAKEAAEWIFKDQKK